MGDVVDISKGNPFAKRRHKLRPEPTAVNYVIDEFWAESFVVLAGTHGMGKTTIVVFLSLVACGAIQVDGLDVHVPRDVLYVTEDVEQLERLIYETVAQWGGDMSIVKERFFLFQAKRDPADTYKYLMAWYVGAGYERGYKHHVTGEPVFIEPILVLDTANACLDVDGDKDNSAIGKTINALRLVFKSVLIVAHVAKGVTRDDPEVISARGATAWVADAQTEWVLFEDKNVPYARFIYSDSPKKRRDAGRIRELKFETTIRKKKARDDFGFERELKTVVVMEASYSDKQARQDAAYRTQRKQEEKLKHDYQKAITDKLEAAQRARLDNPSNLDCYYSKDKLINELLDAGMIRAKLRMAFDDLLNVGEIEHKALDKSLFDPKPKWSKYVDVRPPNDEA